jgi:hypothetical protein
MEFNSVYNEIVKPNNMACVVTPYDETIFELGPATGACGACSGAGYIML